MKVYHGGKEEIRNSEMNQSRNVVDFGSGFYVTTIYEQAARWCEKRKRRTNCAIVNHYELEKDSIAKLKVLSFESYSEQWLDFIVMCRMGKDNTDWDIVMGGIANDRVFDTLEAFFDGFATKEQTIAKLKFEKPNVQICFRTQKALDCLTFVGSTKL